MEKSSISCTFIYKGNIILGEGPQTLVWITSKGVIDFEAITRKSNFVNLPCKQALQAWDWELQGKDIRDLLSAAMTTECVGCPNR